MKAKCLAAALLVTCPAVAKADACSELTGFEEQISPTLPRAIDETTELAQVKVNCETKRWLTRSVC